MTKAEGEKHLTEEITLTISVTPQKFSYASISDYIYTLVTGLQRTLS